MTTYNVKDEIILEVTKPVETTEETNEYKLDFLLDQEIAIGNGLSTDTWFEFTIPASSATEPCPSIVPCEFNMIKHTGSSNYNVAGVYYYYSS